MMNDRSPLPFLYLLPTYFGFAVMVLAIILRPTTEGTYAAFFMVLPALLMMLAGTVCGFVILHRTWPCVVQHGPHFKIQASVRDAAAAWALLFLPFFNLYWVFIAFGRLPKELNALAQALGIRARAHADLGNAIAGLSLVAIVPFVGVLAALINALVLLPIFLVTNFRLSESITDHVAGCVSPQAEP